MLKQNNSEIDAGLISEKVAKNAATLPLRTLPETKFVKLDNDVEEPILDADQAMKDEQESAQEATRRDAEALAAQRPSGFFSYMLWRFQKVAAPGLSLKQRLRLVPGLGYFIAWVIAIIKLPASRYHTAVAIDILQRQAAGKRLDELEQQVRRISPESHQSALDLQAYDALDIGNRLMRLDQLQINRKFKAIHQLMQLRHTEELALRRENASLLARLELLERQLQGSVPAGAPIGAPSQSGDIDIPKPQAEEMGFERDKFYLEFEAKFRGSQEDIKQRLSVYLPYLDYLKNIKVDERPVVIDVGCGRGEWLDLMGEQDIPALGIDMNVAMVERCLQRGFAAKCADAIAYLREQPEGSVGAITGFHLIEHLSFETMIALFDAALYALRPGGIIIFETPNPENLIVGACNFYYDPTHLHPIVPDVAEFIARQRGYSHAEILRLHPFPADYQMQGGSAVDQVINKFMFSAQDYAVIARK